jgi:hypothetical protein
MAGFFNGRGGRLRLDTPAAPCHSAGSTFFPNLAAARKGWRLSFCEGSDFLSPTTRQAPSTS